MIAAVLLALAAAAPLTEADAVALALGRDASLSALAHGAEEAGALRDAAARWSNPELRVGNVRSDWLRDPPPGAKWWPAGPLDEARIGVRWTPPALGERGAQRAAGDARAAEAAGALALARRRAAATVRALHATALALDAQLETARAILRERDAQASALRRLVDARAATALDQARAEADRLEAASDVQELEAERARVRAALAAAVGLPAGADLALDPAGGTACAPPGDAAGLRLRAEEQAAAASGAPALLRAADAERSRLDLALVPWLTFVQVSYLVGGGPEPDAWALQLGLALPLLDWKGDDRRAIAARRARIEDERRAALDGVDRQLDDAVAEQSRHAARAARHRATAALLEDGVARLARAQPAATPLAIAEASDLRARALAARRAQQQAELACALDRVEVERLTSAGPGAR